MITPFENNPKFYRWCSISIQATVHKLLPFEINGILSVFPPLTEYYFSMFVNVNLIPGYLSRIPISKWIQKYFYGDAKNYT